MLDGGVMENTAFDFGGWEDPVDELDKLTLENPFFRIILTMQLGNDGLTTHIRSIALQDIDSTGIDLNVAVLEKVVSGYTGKNGDTEFRNVVLDMLPTPAGTLFARSWNKGDEEKRTFRWDYKYMEDQDYDELMIVAFLQDSKTGKILQVAAAENSEYPMAVQNHHVKELSLYPNPSRSVIYVDHAGLLTSGGIIEITDMTGRIMQKYRVVPGEQVSEIQLHDLSPGTYLLTAKGPEGQLARSSFIKTD